MGDGSNNDSNDDWKRPVQKGDPRSGSYRKAEERSPRTPAPKPPTPEKRKEK